MQQVISETHFSGTRTIVIALLMVATWILFPTAANAASENVETSLVRRSDPESSRVLGPSYRVDLGQALTRYITVTMVAEAEGDETQLMMPTWTPGSYLIREYAKHIDRIAAKDTDGNPLSIEKISKNRWRVVTKDVKRFEVSYRLFCDEVSVRTNSVNFNRAVLNGAATFLSIPEQHDRMHRIKLILPRNWSTSSTSLRRTRGEHSYSAENYDEVVDSPIVAGNVMVYPFEVAGVDHFLVNVGQANDFDYQTAIGDITKMVEQHHRLWGEVPYDRYYFITVFGGGGGLEHDNSCLMMVPRLDPRDRGSYRNWLSLASHEFFHTWNIRRLRPKELVKYDYENETYTPSLWIAEGTTSYYEDLLLVRAGLIDRDEYLQLLNGSIQQLQRTEGRLVQSLRDSSHDAWIKFYRPESNSNSTQISYYTKGAIVSLLLDMRIRTATQGAKSLDDVLRLLWQRHKGQTGYRESEFRELCNEVAGEDLETWFARSVDSTEELDYQQLADWLGLEIGNIKPQNASSSEESSDQVRPGDQTQKQARRWVGIGEFDSPATKAGLADTDEVIAVNGKRVSASEVESLAQQFEVGEPIKVTIARDEVLQEILLVVGARAPVINWSIKTAGRTTRQQRKNLRDWTASLPDPNRETAEKKSADDGSESKPAAEENVEADSEREDEPRKPDAPAQSAGSGSSPREKSEKENQGEDKTDDSSKDEQESESSSEASKPSASPRSDKRKEKRQED